MKGAVLRTGINVFLGWGQPSLVIVSSPSRGEEHREARYPHHRIPAVLWVPPALRVALARAAGLMPGVVEQAEAAGWRLHRPPRFSSAVLLGEPAPPELETSFRSKQKTWATGVTAMAGAVVVAALGARQVPLLPVRGRLWQAVVLGPLQQLRRVHSGYVGDCVAWFMLASGGLIAGTTLLLSAAGPPSGR